MTSARSSGWPMWSAFLAERRSATSALRVRKPGAGRTAWPVELSTMRVRVAHMSYRSVPKWDVVMSATVSDASVPSTPFAFLRAPTTFAAVAGR